MRYVMLLVLAATLAACGHSLAELDAIDDAACRKTVSERGDDYNLCRARMADYRRSRAIAVSGRN